MITVRRGPIWSWGIRARVVVPLIAISLLLSLAGGSMIQRVSGQHSRDHLAARANAIAHSICHLAETTDSEVLLQRFVAAMAAEQDVKLIVVAAGEPLVVVAASKTNWLGLRASKLPDPDHTSRDLYRAIESNQPHIEFEHDQENSVDFTVPLRSRIRSTNPLAWSKGAVMLHLDGRPYMRQQAASMARLLTALFVTIAVAAVVALGLISFVVLRPAKRIARVVHRIAEGDRTIRVNIAKSDELGQLAADVDSMLDELVRREELELQAKEEALLSQRQMQSVLAELACSNHALDQHAIVAMTDLRGVITYVNDKFCEISQYQRDELIGCTHRVVNSGHHPKSFWKTMWRTVVRGEVWHGEVCNRAKDGSLYWVDTTVVPYKDAQGRINKYVAIRTDITSRKSFEEELRESQERFELAVRGSSDGIWDWNVTTGEVYYSARFKELLGYQNDEFLDHLDSFRDHLHPDDAAATWEALKRHFDHDESYDVTYRLRTKTGQWRWFRAKGIAVRNPDKIARRMAGSISDITAFKKIEQQLATDATHDRLTGLPNRVLLLDRVERAMDRMKHHERLYAVLFLDFDRFKLINDSLGHEAGDDLLRQIAARLNHCVGHDDSARRDSIRSLSARLGGDEFIVLLEDISSSDDVFIIAERLLRTLADPYQLGDQEVCSTASIGVVVGCPSYDRADEVVRDADTAMYEAKRNGKGRYVLFDETMRNRVQRRRQLEEDLHRAIETDGLRLEYEPIVDLQSGTTHSLEAHVCWQHPVYGDVARSEFMPIAEESGLPICLAKWMLRAVCGQLQQWQREQADAVPSALSINLSPKQFAVPSLARVVSQILDEFKVEPCCLQLEITEAAFLNDLNAAAEQVRQLRAIGVRVAIDNFGAGTSSFTALHRLGVDSLKIDRSIMVDLQNSKEAASLIQGLAVIVRNIGISLVAVGIEATDQLISLQGLGCELAQGQFFGPPLPAEGVADFLHDPSTHSYEVRGAALFAASWVERLQGHDAAETPPWPALGSDSAPTT